MKEGEGRHGKRWDTDNKVSRFGIQGEGFKSLKERDHVEFEVTKDAKGPKAVNVRVIR